MPGDAGRLSPMPNAEVVALAIASLLRWECKKEDHLRELIGSWQHADLLSNEEKELVVQLVAAWPEGRLGSPRPIGEVNDRGDVYMITL